MAINFKNIIRDFERQKAKLPLEIATMAKNHFKENFRQQGFVDRSVEKWEPRKFDSAKDKRFRERTGNASVGAGRAILVNTGALRQSIDYTTATFSLIQIETVGIEYGYYHNTGDTRDGVKREFMGKSEALTDKIVAKVNKEIGNVLGRKT